MKERRYVRFRVDMYEDTKFKIIDRMTERDVMATYICQKTFHIH